MQVVREPRVPLGCSCQSCAFRVQDLGTLQGRPLGALRMMQTTPAATSLVTAQTHASWSQHCGRKGSEQLLARAAVIMQRHVLVASALFDSALPLCVLFRVYLLRHHMPNLPTVVLSPFRYLVPLISMLRPHLHLSQTPMHEMQHAYLKMPSLTPETSPPLAINPNYQRSWFKEATTHPDHLMQLRRPA